MITLTYFDLFLAMAIPFLVGLIAGQFCVISERQKQKPHPFHRTDIEGEIYRKDRITKEGMKIISRHAQIPEDVHLS